MGKLIIIPNADFSSVAVSKVTPIMGKIKISVEASPTEGGRVTGGGSYSEGMQATLSAIPNSAYTFKNWNDGDTNATRSVLVTSEDASYTAIFEAKPRIILGPDDLIGTRDVYKEGVLTPNGASQTRYRTDKFAVNAGDTFSYELRGTYSTTFKMDTFIGFNAEGDAVDFQHATSGDTRTGTYIVPEGIVELQVFAYGNEPFAFEQIGFGE